LLTVLVVAEPPGQGPQQEPDSSLEVLHARDAEEAVEKLARNRRIDAVLVLSQAEAPAIVAAIREDVLAPPPIFLAEGSPQIPGTRALAAREPARLVELVAQELAG
jgi:hypothetical protein